MASSTVELILNMEPKEFLQVQDEFLADLAALLTLDISEIWIADIQSGCTILVLVLPDGSEPAFLRHFASDGHTEAARSLRRKYPVRRGYSAGTVEAPNLSIARQIRRSHAEERSREEARKFTWLHISDLHALAPGTGRALEQSVVTEKFVEQLPLLLKAHKIVPDAVFLTGDVAQSGEPQEYAVARDFLKSVVAKLSDSTKVFVIPGNHKYLRRI